MEAKELTHPVYQPTHTLTLTHTHTHLMHSVSSDSVWKFFFSADITTAFLSSSPLATTCR
jgi:hypothetical protein